MKLSLPIPLPSCLQLKAVTLQTLFFIIILLFILSFVIRFVNAAPVLSASDTDYATEKMRPEAANLREAKQSDFSEPGLSLKPFVANYMVTAMGLEGINVTNSLSLDKNKDEHQEYQFKSYSMSVGLLAFKKDETRDEQSKGIIKQNQIQPERYSFLQFRDNETHRHVEIEFDWESSEVINNHKHQNSKWTMSVPLNTIDKLSYQLSLMLKLADKPEKNFSFNIADGGRVKEYNFEILGEERVYTSLGSYKAIKIHHQRYHKDKNITLWCAPELHFLPVKITQEEVGKPTFISTLISYQEGMTGSH